MTTDALEGTQVGAYRIVRRIGAGGMGEVWMAEHAMLGRRAAIKFLRAQYSHDAQIVGRFFNEARAATAISDPGIVQIFDFGYHDDGSAYIVMELLEGEPLDRRLRSGALAVADAVRLMRQVAMSIAAAHARGIVHRDLKPENLFLVRDPEVPGGERVKILDFGIAKLGGQHAGVKTQTAAMLGTPLYMSPEQCRGAGDVDQRSDVYALGCVLFVIVTGRPPFDGAGVGEIIAMHLREPAPRASSLVPGLPRSVDDVIARCLEKSPERRFASAAELAAALTAIVSTSATVLASAASRVGQLAMPTTLSSLAVEVPHNTSRRNWLLAALAGVAVATAIIFTLARGSTPRGDAAPVETVAPRPPPAPPDAAVIANPWTHTTAITSIEVGARSGSKVAEAPVVIRKPTTKPRPRPPEPKRIGDDDIPSTR